MSLFESTTPTLDSKKCKGCGETFYREPTQVGKATRSWLMKEYCSKKCYRVNNAEYIKKMLKEYNLKNKDKLAEQRKEYHKRKLKEDPSYKQKRAEYNKIYRKENKLKIKETKDKYYQKNKDHLERKRKENYLNNIEHYQNKTMLRTYGITLEKYNKMLLEQNGCCAICKKHADEVKNKRMILPLFIDHDHKTNKVRALLCLHCNSAIGFLREDVNVAEKVIKYLKEHNARV
tara:strand:+ start:1282 stop:1977 length:696 start_codon:yes stop_codon:yes gene_type:complete